MVFFEIPYHCYEKTTFTTNHSYNTVKRDPTYHCQENLVLIGLYEINDPQMYAYRIVEMFLLFSFTCIQITFWGERRILGKYSSSYKFMQISLFVCIACCFFDILFALIFGYYPLINFFLRGIVIILLIRNLRLVWVNIIFLLYDTKMLFFLLLAVLFWFGLIGFTTFHYSQDFNNIPNSMYSLFILLATCNFPDVMLGTFSVESKYSFLFFVCYLLINFFIVLSLLKSLYYSSYFEVYKARARKILRFLIDKEEMQLNTKLLFEQDSFNRLILRIKTDYSLNHNEFKELVNLVNSGYELYTEEEFYDFLKQDKHEYHDFINKLRQSKVEFVLIIIDMILNVVFFYIDHTLISTIIQLVWYCLFLIEFIYYCKLKGIIDFIKTDLIRFLYLTINLLNFIAMIIVLVFIIFNKDDLLDKVSVVFDSFVFLRSIRFFILLNIFPEFSRIFTTLHSMKTIFYGLLSSLFSFFFLFSTLSMFLTGGHILKEGFVEKPEYIDDYKHLNFNDFPSSFITCFALMMINNLNILAKTLSYGVNPSYRAYFALFYFIASLVILNIIQTLMLEMYLTISDRVSTIKDEAEKDKDKDDDEIKKMQ